MEVRRNIVITQQVQGGGRRCTPSFFSREWFAKKSWLVRLTLYFASLLSQTAETEPAWIQSGVTDLKHSAEKARRHEQAKSHMENANASWHVWWSKYRCSA